MNYIIGFSILFLILVALGYIQFQYLQGKMSPVKCIFWALVCGIIAFATDFYIIGW